MLAYGWLVLGCPVWAEHWPQFRGPRGDGTSVETNVPVRWGPVQHVVWKAAIPGSGHSSPIVWSNRVFVTTALEEAGERALLCLDTADGKILWQKGVVTASAEARHRENGLASSTPATDGRFVFTSFQAGDRVDIRCFDYSGREVWYVQPLQFTGEHGYSYSPILYKDTILFDCRQDGEAALLALHKRNGTTKWRVTPGRQRISHVTPLLVPEAGRVQLVVCGSDEIRSYDPDTGREFWRCNGPGDVAVAGLSHGEGLVFATAGYPSKARMAVRIFGQGDVTHNGVLWSKRGQVTYVPSPVYHRGFLYTMVDDGIMYCFNAKTGDVVWEHRVGGRYRSSLVLAGGNLYATDEQGTTTVFRASPREFAQVAVNELREFCYATPAISNGRLYMRAGKQLYCIAEPRAGR